MVSPTNHVIARPRFTLSWAPSTLGFSQYFSAKYRWRPKKSPIRARGHWHCAICWIRPWLLYYVHKKVTWGAELATFRIKTLNFSWVTRLNCNIKLRVWAPGSTLLLGANLNIIVGDPFKLVGKNYIEGARTRNNIIVGGPYELVGKN